MVPNKKEDSQYPLFLHRILHHMNKKINEIIYEIEATAISIPVMILNFSTLISIVRTAISKPLIATSDRIDTK